MKDLLDFFLINVYPENYLIVYAGIITFLVATAGYLIFF